MKKIFISLVIAGIFCLNAALAQPPCAIGVRLMKDSYSGKVFVLKTYKNSSAEEYGLKEGSEIISVNGKNAKKLNIDEIVNMIQGKESTRVKLTVRYYREQETIEIPRTYIKKPKQEKYETYWNEIVPSDVIVESFHQNILNNLNRKLYSEIVPSINYWVVRKAEFKDAYNMCMLYPAEEKQKTCVTKLVKWASDKTIKDIERESAQSNVNQKVIKNNISTQNKIQIRSDI